MEKTAIITGGTSGIGLAVAKKFLEEGINVIAAGIDSPKTINMTIEKTKLPGRIEYRYLDVRNGKSCLELVKYGIENHKKIDILVNAAGGKRKSRYPIRDELSGFGKYDGD